MTQEKVKISFEAEKWDEDGDYPVLAYESIWCVDLGDGTYRVDNVPWWSTRASYGDIIRAEWCDEGGLRQLEFVEVVRAGGHTTVRIFVNDEDDIEPLERDLDELGFRHERWSSDRLVAASIPPGADVEWVIGCLYAGVVEDFFTYEPASETRLRARLEAERKTAHLVH